MIDVLTGEGFAAHAGKKGRCHTRMRTRRKKTYLKTIGIREGSELLPVKNNFALKGCQEEGTVFWKKKKILGT